MTTSDSSIIGASQADPEVFVQLYDRHCLAIHAYLARRAGSQTAEDLLSDVWLQALRSRDSYDLGREDARPWLYGIARNILRRHWRDGGRPNGRAEDVAMDPWDDVDARLDSNRLMASLTKWLAELPREQREVLELVAWEQLLPGEVAEILELPAGTVRWRLHQARGQLRQRLAETSGNGPTLELNKEQQRG